MHESYFSFKYTHRLRVKECKMSFEANGNQNQAKVGILISDKIDFNLKMVQRDKEGHCVMIKGQSIKEI